MTMFRPRAKHDHDHPVGDAAALSAAAAVEEHERILDAAIASVPYSPVAFAAWAKLPNVPANGEGREFF